MTDLSWLALGFILGIVIGLGVIVWLGRAGR